MPSARAGFRPRGGSDAADVRVLVCPTAFKCTLGAGEASAALAEGVRRARPDATVREMPLSDGGPGLLAAIRATRLASSVEEVPVRGPLGGRASARILWLAENRLAEGRGDHALLESADACGLHLVPEGDERPLESDTRGVGELISAALERGAERVTVGLGGSATSDGGTGMARVFGYRFLDAEGRDLPPGCGALPRLARIVAPDRGENRGVDRRVDRGSTREAGASFPVPIIALADVESPLNGAAGAARRFGPQKGATREEVDRLVRGLERLSVRLERDLGRPDVGGLTGSGAAGGMGAGMAAFLGAEIRLGADWVLERVGFEEALATADLLITGEGAWDASSGAGKITGRVLDRARRAQVPALLLCGRLAGRVPEGVRAAHGDGARLDAEGLASLAARELGRC